jgi:hypothetical protein
MLGALGAAAAGSLAGCTAGYRGRDAPPRARPPTGGAPVDLPVPWADIRQPLTRDAIPAIVEPVFAEDWSRVDPEVAGREGLADGDAVIGVERGGEARAYPLAVLSRHEVVNDDFGPSAGSGGAGDDGTTDPLLVTYCPLCGSAVAAERRVDGRVTRFGVSGALWRGDLVLYDEATESLWSQLLATAIRGPRTGEQLALVPARLTSLGAWRASHPDTSVLLPPPHSGTIDGSPPAIYDEAYAYDNERQLVGFDGGDSGGGALDRTTLVVGVTDGDLARAYPHFVVREAGGVVEDRVGDLPVVVTTTPGGGLAAYDRRLDGRALGFDAVGGPEGAAMRAGGSRWVRESGRATGGPHAGRRLDRANEIAPLFWHAWAAFHPSTGVYGVTADG